MQSVHVKNLEKYHPGYKDRTLVWCKVYFTMLNAEPEFEMIDEIDKWRFVAFVILELQAKRPIPLEPKYLARKGFNLKKRPISLTIQMLQNFLETVDTNGKVRALDKIRVEKSRVDKSYTTEFEYFWKHWKGRWNKEDQTYTKVGKREAFAEWEKLSLEDKRWAATVAEKAVGEYTPDACRWLKRRMFEDFKKPEPKGK